MVNKIEITDCSIISDWERAKIISQYSENAELNLFSLGEKTSDDQSLIHFHQNRWWTGRFVGEANFRHDKINYHLKIEPRFGFLHLFHMLETIFNVKILDDLNEYGKGNQNHFMLQLLIKKLWIKHLSEANRHGLPRKVVKEKILDQRARGRIDVRKSIMPIFTKEKLVSEYRYKQTDLTVARIIFQAYNKLSKNYALADIELSPNAKEALGQINSFGGLQQRVSRHDYSQIKLGSIYQNYKTLLDFSWRIINDEIKGFSKQETSQKGFSLFFDMAEIWELYLLELLKNNFPEWQISSPKIQIYNDKAFKRHIIPDIVMEKDDKIMVFDAKYKKMEFEKYDYDRADFFQIHTYMAYFQAQKNLIGGGLLYPIRNPFTPAEIENNQSEFLISNKEGKPISFNVDGIDFSGLDSTETDQETQIRHFQNAEEEFINRIKELIKGVTT